jgi:methylated-DNA-[protein]-cysteine S-methyltransferase
MTRTAISLDSPVGRLLVAEAEEAIVAIGWIAGAEDEPTPLLREACRQLAAYFAGRLGAFDLPLKPAGTPFKRRVWAAMQEIPYGETRRYGELAMEVGSAPRAIGRACGRNPIPIVIPCHRVLARGGIGGYSGGAGLATKRALLALESAVKPSPSLPAQRSNLAELGADAVEIAASLRSSQ